MVDAIGPGEGDGEAGRVTTARGAGGAVQQASLGPSVHGRGRDIVVNELSPLHESEGVPLVGGSLSPVEGQGDLPGVGERLSTTTAGSGGGHLVTVLGRQEAAEWLQSCARGAGGERVTVAGVGAVSGGGGAGGEGFQGTLLPFLQPHLHHVIYSGKKKRLGPPAPTTPFMPLHKLLSDQLEHHGLLCHL